MLSNLINEDALSHMTKCLSERYQLLSPSNLHYVYVLYREGKAVHVGAYVGKLVQSVIHDQMQRDLIEFDGYSFLCVPKEELDLIREAFRYALDRGDLDVRD